jgi:pyruvate dehydrogenase E2 component (dihydrolipoamide acetyltransferase)
MARPILMPQVGQDLTEGKVTAILVKVGDKVKKGDIVAEVESEKAVFEVEAFETGTIIDIAYKVGDMAVVLEPLMMVGEEGEVYEKAAAPAASVATPSVVEVAAHPVVAAKSVPAQVEALASATALAVGGGSSPLARRLAVQAGIDIASVAGSGPRGAVVKRDIEAFQKSAPKGSVLAFTGGSRNVAAKAGDSVIKSLQTGTGDPVLFIHGFGSELSSWRPFVSQLGIGNPVLAVDLPGHGAASAGTAEEFDALVRSVRSAMAAEGLERVHLVGHSLGAAVCSAIAGGGDLDVRSLTLIAPAGLGPKINGDYVAGFLSSSTEAALKAWLDLLVADPAKLPGVLVRATLAARETGPVVENQARLAAGVFAGSTQLFSVRDALARYEGPARIIVGQQDRIVPSDHADAAPAHVAVNRLPGVGHLPQLEAAALTGRLVAQTIRSAG